MVPMLISVFGVCVLRLVWLFTVVPAHHTIEAVELSYPITWAVTSAAVLIYYRWGALAAAAERDGINDRTQRCGSGQGLPRRR